MYIYMNIYIYIYLNVYATISLFKKHTKNKISYITYEIIHTCDASKINKQINVYIYILYIELFSLSLSLSRCGLSSTTASWRYLIELNSSLPFCTVISNPHARKYIHAQLIHSKYLVSACSVHPPSAGQRWTHLKWVDFSMRMHQWHRSIASHLPFTVYTICISMHTFRSWNIALHFASVKWWPAVVPCPKLFWDDWWEPHFWWPLNFRYVEML